MTHQNATNTFKFVANAPKLVPCLLAVLLSSLALSLPLSAQPLETYDDEFDNPSTLTNWQRNYLVEGWNANQLETWDIDTTQADRMVMIPYTSTWFNDYRGSYAFKTITGDFVATTEVFVDDRHPADGNMIPESDYSLCGILVRRPRAITNPAVDWTPGGENYVFLSLGNGNSGGTSFQFEVKTTVNSVSTLILQNTTSNTALIQIARIGGDLIMLRKIPSEPWVVHRRYDRDDFPATLQVGAFAYTDWPNVSGSDPFTNNSTVNTNPGNNPDLIAGFEYFHFRAPNVPPALAGQDLGPNGSVTDTELLNFLGYNANQPVTEVEYWLNY